jgi:hypothetical protein
MLGPADAVAPYAVYGVISASGLAAESEDEETVDQGVFQVSVYASSHGEAWTLSRKAAKTLNDNVPSGKLAFSDVTFSDVGREKETGLYHVAVRVAYSYARANTV